MRIFLMATQQCNAELIDVLPYKSSNFKMIGLQDTLVVNCLSQAASKAPVANG